MFIRLCIKSQLTAAIIATLLLPLPIGAVPPKIPYCIGGEPIRQIDNVTIICRQLTPISVNPNFKTIDEISLYRFDGTNLKTAINIVVYSYGLKLVTMNVDRIKPKDDFIVYQFWLVNRKFEKWVDNANPDLLTQRRNDMTLLLDTLQTSPPSRPSF